MSREIASPEIANLVAARLSPEEFQRRIEAPLTDAEAADIAELVTWFSRRYPTAEERLAYARRKVRQYAGARSVAPVPAGYRETAQRLARAHCRAEPETVGVWIDPDPEEREIRLVEVVRSAPTLRQPLAVEFVARPDLGIPFPLELLLLSPDEWSAVGAGELDLPEPFVVARLEPL